MGCLWYDHSCLAAGSAPYQQIGGRQRLPGRWTHVFEKSIYLYLIETTPERSKSPEGGLSYTYASEKAGAPVTGTVHLLSE